MFIVLDNPFNLPLLENIDKANHTVERAISQSISTGTFTDIQSQPTKASIYISKGRGKEAAGRDLLAVACLPLEQGIGHVEIQHQALGDPHIQKKSESTKLCFMGKPNYICICSHTSLLYPFQ